MTGYVGRVMASDTQVVCTYILIPLNNVVTLRIQRIINMVRNVNWYQGMYAVRRYITVDMYSVLQDVSFSS